MRKEPLLEVRDLHIGFSQDARENVPAVRGADLKLYEGEILGLVGESGSGKSVTALSVTRLLPASAKVISGKIIFDGADMLELPEEDLRKVRGSRISYVFQDPASSLNPVFTVGEQIIEAITLHRGVSRGEAFDLAVGSLADVGMPAPSEIMFSYPHQLSGGMRQRAMIAMAISCRPRLLIADEPTTALDVTVQAQILDLLLSLKEVLGLTVLLITHGLSIVSRVAQKTAVMRQGRIVEYGDTELIYKKPSHPYTKGLISCIPKMRNP
jgi:ABC-type dipeptide/oligopeptide/nickel transport system ATPase component